MEERRRLINPFKEMYSQEFPITPTALDMVYTWSIDDRPVTLREYISARMLDAAEKLGIEQIENTSVVDVNQIDDESIWKIIVYHNPALVDAFKLDGRELAKRVIEDFFSDNPRYPGLGISLNGRVTREDELIEARRSYMHFLESIYRNGNVRLEMSPS